MFKFAETGICKLPPFSSRPNFSVCAGMQCSTAGRASVVQCKPRPAPPLQMSAPPCNQHRRFRKRSWSSLQIKAKAASAETEEAPKVTRSRGRPAKNGSTAAPKQARSQEPPPLPLVRQRSGDPSSSAPPMSSPAWWQNADLACLSFSLQQLLTCSASCLQPQSYQQTLKQSFLLGGVGLHTGEYGELLDCLFWSTLAGRSANMAA